MYSDRLFLKALIIMLVRHLHNVHALLAVLAEPTAEMVLLRALLTEQDRYPDVQHLGTPPESHAGTHCRPRLAVWDAENLGSVDPTLGGLWAGCGHRQYDSLANGGVWHKKDRDKGVVPHTSIDTRAHGTKSGWHGSCYGWMFYWVVTAAAVWISLAADLTPP